ncbi:MAG TPA: ubiquinol oxidase subunit II [Gammaproteobacteria bacterium]|nr:ubiquinol oxidase subunit II [Gammaproteobacteria bacterium]
MINFSFLKKNPLSKGLQTYSCVLVCGALLAGCHHSETGGVLNPKGLIAKTENEILFSAVGIMLLVVIPVIVMSFIFAYRYRATNKNHPSYQPTWSHSVLLEAIWWGIPCIIIVVLSVITWNSTHKLDPYQPFKETFQMEGKPLRIDAVSLEWKWLFIYPEQNIATINHINIPKDREIEFWITSEAPMSSFFIPQLGSQIYSMAGMRTKLHLIANETGQFEGLNSQYNGDGFSHMRFNVDVTDSVHFDQWVKSVKHSPKNKKLTRSLYCSQLLEKSIKHPSTFYSSVDEPNKMFHRIMAQYMKPDNQYCESIVKLKP